MKDKITASIRQFVADYERREGLTEMWGTPLVGFADANHPRILQLKERIAPTHMLPREVLADASIIIVYFVPFSEALAKTNQSGTMASPEWARAYETTNAMFAELNAYLMENLRSLGHQAAVSPAAAVFDRKALRSDWSQRHFAWAAGLGTFGLNNMLITPAGCCGRCGSVVTNLPVAAGAPLAQELCFYKRSGACGVCARRCPAEALTLGGYDRQRCYALLKKNAALYTQFGSSYEDASSDAPQGSEVCGKCVVNAPCAFQGAQA